MKVTIMKMMSVAFAVASLSLIGCGSDGVSVEDSDGNSYSAMKIGKQTWMAENLNVDVEGSWCYDNDPANCEKYGRLYTWKAAMNACPAGWRLPSALNFQMLLNDIGSSEENLEANRLAARNLRATSWDSGKDKYGFSVLPGGYYYSPYKEFGRLGSGAFFWSSTESDRSDAYFLWIDEDIVDDGYDVVGVDYDDKNLGHSVRCLRDECARNLSDKQFCVDGIVYDKCGGEEYDVLEEKCVKNVLYPTCGSSYYHSEKQFCVGGVVYDKCDGEEYDVTEEKCVKNVLYPTCGSSYYHSEKQFCADTVVYDKCGGEEFDVMREFCKQNVVVAFCDTISDKQFCVDGIVYDKCGGEEYDITKKKCVDNVLYSTCGSSYYIPGSNARCINDEIIELSYGELKDSRDGQTYKTIKIGSQTWMAENLNYQIVTSKCYGDKPENCEKYGRLYTWDDAKKACPAGWRLPSKAEFESLLAAVGTSGGEWSLNLRADSWKNGTDKFGFSALPAGTYTSEYGEGFDDLGNSTNFWTSTGYNSYCAYNLGISDGNAYVDYYGKRFGDSVRCLQD
ncbi:MAG: fibrobacter succinogenes major paralogous domain-containing protein [Fibrobacter sp.]|nr:fibrobacter succinogenes major paralogous domain-containing protein [Fibrobacter sp.]MCQ2092446.1 fibrobacter succinogenes major paralogous domain-containing protein [Fibrobacter sp.]